MTLEELNSLNLPFKGTDVATPFYVESGLEWLKANTTLEFDTTNMEDIKALPPGAKLFLVKFVNIMEQDSNVASESIGSLSKSYASKEVGQQLKQCAKGLIPGYLKSQFIFIPCGRRWL